MQEIWGTLKSNERYPTDLVVGLQDFKECGWKTIISNTTLEGYRYHSMWQAFSSAARQTIGEGHQASGKVLWLLADACSMMLSPESANEPFKPLMVIEGRRSVIPDDLSESEYFFFSQIVDEIDDPWLKARLADLVWLKQQPSNVAFALAAIDAYQSIPLDTKTWLYGGDKCWERAFRLTRMLSAGADNRLKEMEEAVIKAFEGATAKDGFLVLWLVNLLDSNALGRGIGARIAQRLESLAREFDMNGDLHRAREYFDASANWFKKAGDEAKRYEMTVAVAEGWVKEADARISSDKPSHMAAASFYEKAIQIYRTIPRSERAVHRVDERIAELRSHLNKSGEKSLDEMRVFSTQSIDISEIVETARNLVRGKTMPEALLAFVNLDNGPKANTLRNSATARLRQYLFPALIPGSLVSSEGRVIAKRPGMSLSGEPTDSDEIVIRAAMIEEYRIHINIIVWGSIWPALEVLLLEHRLHEADFIGLAKQSPIVPIGRELLFGKALFSGYDRDFVTALHLLVPQIEHMVRFHLKAVGAKTTNLDTNGIENENGLSTLMDMPEVTKVFGEDLAFEIKALFCDPFGPNLRNELAHGLIDVETCQSFYSIYAWWFGLKLVFNTFWNTARRENQEPENGVRDDQPTEQK